MLAAKGGTCVVAADVGVILPCCLQHGSRRLPRCHGTEADPAAHGVGFHEKLVCLERLPMFSCPLAVKTNETGLFWKVAGAVAIALAALFVFWPALRGDWIWDDFSAIALNPVLRDRTGLWRIWFAPPGPDYFPLTSTVEWLEWHAWGAATTGYHLVSVASHVLGALLLWRLLARLGSGLAWLGGFVFAIHPLAVQSVAWISEQKNTLSLPLLLLAAGAYLDFDEAPRFRPYLRSLLYFLAAMLCKSSVVMFPAVLLLYAWWRRGRVAMPDLAASGPFFAISVVLGFVTAWFQTHNVFASEPIEIGGMLSRFACAGLVIAFYAGKCVLPVGLMPIYPRWAVDPPSVEQFWPWLLGGILAGLLWVGRAWMPEGIGWRRGVSLGVCFFAVNLLPVLGFIPMFFMRIGWVSDHLAYLPLIGPVGLAVAGAGWVCGKLGPRWRLLTSAAAGLILAALMLESRAQAAIYRSDTGFWAYAIAKNPGATVAHYSLANARVRCGQLAEAIPEYEAAIRLRPDFARARSSYGDVLFRLGRTSEAAAQYETALRDDPGLVATREKFGDLLLAQGRTEDAIAEYERAVAVQPDNARAQGNLAYALARAGRLEDSAARYETALKLDPSRAEDWDQRGTVLAHLGRAREAQRHYERALQLKPDDPDAHNNLGLLLARAGRLTDAIRHFEAALRSRPDFPAARRNLELARQALAAGDEGR
jgi:tetratricopeptide (TPR) repeat protein